MLRLKDFEEGVEYSLEQEVVDMIDGKRFPMQIEVVKREGNILRSAYHDIAYRMKDLEESIRRGNEFMREEEPNWKLGSVKAVRAC